MLPVNRAAILMARSLAELIRTSVQLTLVTVLAVLVFGFSASGGLLGVVCAILVAVSFGWGISWIFLSLAAGLRSMEKIQLASVVLMFPLMFGSNAYVPIEGLPGWMQAAASINPLSTAITAVRALALGDFAPSDVIRSLLLTALLALIGILLADRGFRREIT